MWRRLETYKRQLQKTRALITPWYVSFSVLLLLQVNKTNPNRHHRKRRNLSVGLGQRLSWMQMLSQGLWDPASLCFSLQVEFFLSCSGRAANKATLCSAWLSHIWQESSTPVSQCLKHHPSTSHLPEFLVHPKKKKVLRVMYSPPWIITLGYKQFKIPVCQICVFPTTTSLF